MFLKAIIKTDKLTGKRYSYYRLCESYRIDNKVRHRAILSVGKVDDFSNAELKQLADRLEQLLSGAQGIFTFSEKIETIAREAFTRHRNKELVSPSAVQSGRENLSVPDIHKVDLNSIATEDVREVGAEWICMQTIEKLGIKSFLEDMGWHGNGLARALVHLVSRAVYPASEHKTAQWINQNSSVAELFEQQPHKISRFHLYDASAMLYSVKQDIEKYLYKKTNELFDIDDKIILFDLTNTYFEGRKEHSKLARFGRSKEKRSDCKLVAIALVTNAEGFVKYSKIYQGNIADCKCLKDIVDELAVRTSIAGHKPVVVIDAGIANAENLAMLKEQGYDYMCVSPGKRKDFVTESKNPIVALQDNRKHKIQIQRVEKQGDSDVYYCIESEQKGKKEASMESHFSKRYEEELTALAGSVQKKGGTKKYEKVLERIGRIKERTPSANKHYDIEVIENNGIVSEVKWQRKTLKTNSEHGTYFLRTSLQKENEKMAWDIYNAIREIEGVFRTLKTDLRLRPVYHIKDQFSEAHLFLGILAYAIVNTIRHTLKANGINLDWANIVRIMNTQKLTTITMKNSAGQQIAMRCCSKPSTEATQIYKALEYKPMPFHRKKIVFPE